MSGKPNGETLDNLRVTLDDAARAVAVNSGKITLLLQLLAIVMHDLNKKEAIKVLAVAREGGLDGNISDPVAEAHREGVLEAIDTMKKTIERTSREATGSVAAS